MRILTLFLLITLGINLTAQISTADKIKIQKIEDTLHTLGDSLVLSDNGEMRAQSGYLMIKYLVDALKIKHSFNYKFPRVEQFSIVAPEDSNFRLITWQVRYSVGTTKHWGAVQYKTNDGTLKLTPLIDMSDFNTNHDTIFSSNDWLGNLVYNIITKEHKGEKLYFLIGLDMNDKVSTRKIIDVMRFTENGVLFGGPYFERPTPSGKRKLVNRVIVEYKSDASVVCNFFPEENKIIHDHVIPQDSMLIGAFGTYLPDGSYEGYEFSFGVWRYIPKIFDFKSETVPLPKPLKFDPRKK